jgi:hypothetical protein
VQGAADSFLLTKCGKGFCHRGRPGVGSDVPGLYLHGFARRTQIEALRVNHTKVILASHLSNAVPEHLLLESSVTYRPY